MIVLQGNNLARYFGAEELFANLNITIQNHSRIALIGRNGSGKSTLLKILAGLSEPDEGQVYKKRGLSIAYMDQHSGLMSEQTIYEEMRAVFKEDLALLKKAEKTAEELAELADDTKSVAYQTSLDRYDRLQEKIQVRQAYAVDSRIKMVLNGFQFGEEMYDQPISTLSGGQRTRLALAKVLLEAPDILILDEPTNHLDIDSLNWLEQELPKYQGALLLVSHDRYFLNAVTNETVEMTSRSLEHYAGNYDFYLKEKAARLERQEKAYEKQQKRIAELEDYVQKNIARASTTKMAQSRRKQLEKMERLEKPTTASRLAHMDFHVAQESGQKVLELDQVGVGYDTLLSAPINLDLRKEEVVAVVGPNGIGKSTLLKTIIGELPAWQGKIHFGAHVSAGYYDQELGNLRSKKDVLHEIWDEHPLMSEEAVRTLLGRFLFSGDEVKKTVRSLSGGEKARLELAQLSLEHDNLLLLDEPTNHLDIPSKEVLEEALDDYDGTILFVSHDRYFINRLADQVLEISATGSKLYLGDYDYYLNKKAEEKARAAATQKTTPREKVSPKKKENSSKSRDSAREARKVKRQIQAQEEKIQNLEEEIAELEEAMTQPDIFTDQEKIAGYHENVQAKKADLQEALASWEDLFLTLEAYENE